jgi:hypothetical protein
MSVQLVIELSEDVLKALVASRNLTITVTQPAPAGSGSRGSEKQAGQANGGNVIPREGSLPARIIGWAEQHGREFSTVDLVKKFGVTRAHGSMLLAKLANGPYPVARRHRGVYQYAG